MSAGCKHTEHSETVSSLANAAEQCRRDGDFALALDRLSAALKWCPLASATRAGILNNMGHIQVALGLLDAAVLSFTESACIYSETGNHLEQGRQLGNIGSVHRDQKAYAKALVKYRQAVAVLQDEDHLSEVADQYGNLAYIHAMTGDMAEAVHWYARAEHLYLETGEKEKAAKVKKNIATLSAVSGSNR